MKKILACLSVVALVTVLSPSAPSTAAGSAGTVAAATKKASVRDKAGDAPRKIDITRVTVTQRASTVKMVLKVRKLVRTAQSSFTVRGGYEIFDGYPFSDIAVTTWTDEENKVQVGVYGGEDGLDDTCPGLRARWSTKKDTITVVSPRSCESYSWTGTKFSADSSYYSGRTGSDKVRTFKVR